MPWAGADSAWLVGGIPLVQPLSAVLHSTKIFPGLSLDMIEVGESTGALYDPQPD